MELERPRKMELLHTPKAELAKLMRENAVTVDEVLFLFSSNKLTTFDIRMNAPSICDKILNMYLRNVEKTEDKQSLQVDTTPAAMPSMTV